VHLHSTHPSSHSTINRVVDRHSSKSPAFYEALMRTFRPMAARPIHPLPTRLTELISTEICELVITHCKDKATLLACMRVCKAWVPRARFILFSRVICRPSVVIPSGTSASPVSSVVRYRAPDCNREELIYGNADGVHNHSSEKVLLKVKNVSQMEILVEYDLFLCLADGLFCTLPLHRMLSGHANEDDLTVLSEQVHAFDVLQDDMRAQVCIRKGGFRRGIIKIFESRRGVPSEQDVGQTTNSGLHEMKEIFIPNEIRSIRGPRANRGDAQFARSN
ncbi:unnamed protein product, partial [Mycena citricolor]